MLFFSWYQIQLLHFKHFKIDQQTGEGKLSSVKPHSKLNNVSNLQSYGILGSKTRQRSTDFDKGSRKKEGFQANSC